MASKAKANRPSCERAQMHQKACDLWIPSQMTKLLKSYAPKAGQAQPASHSGENSNYIHLDLLTS